MSKNLTRKCFAAILVTFVCLAAQVATGQRAAVKKQPGERESPPNPALFQPGVISIGAATTYRPTFTPDGRTVFYTMEVGRDYVILESRYRNGRWTRPEIAPFSGRYSDAEAFISPDGTRLFFASKRPVGSDGPKEDYDIWFVERAAGDRWGEPQHLGDAVNTADRELYPAVTADGTLYFSRSGPEGSDLWRSRPVGGEYAEAERLEPPVNTDSREAGVYVSPDERFIIFESNRPGGLGGTDLYISHLRQGAWTEPRNLGAPINSAANETSAIVSLDGKRIYFASNRRLPRAAAIGEGLKYAELLDRLGSPGNGLWHIYYAGSGIIFTGLNAV